MKASTRLVASEPRCRMCSMCDRDVTTYPDHETMLSIHYDATCCDPACRCPYKPNLIFHLYITGCCDECLKDS